MMTTDQQSIEPGDIGAGDFIATAVPVAEDPPAVKPPPMVLGVQGIDAKPVHEMNQIDWATYIVLPPFQMFAAEKMPNATSEDSQRHALIYCQNNGHSPAIIEEYCAWHKAKGYWKNETPTGQIIEG